MILAATGYNATMILAATSQQYAIVVLAATGQFTTMVLAATPLTAHWNTIVCMYETQARQQNSPLCAFSPHFTLCLFVPQICSNPWQRWEQMLEGIIAIPADF